MADKLPVNEQRLAAATKRAVQAAGGLANCEKETGLSDSQISRCGSPNQRDSITIRDAVRIDAIGHGEQGHPHILIAMASILDCVVIPLPEPVTDDRCLQMGVLDMSSELGDVSRAIADALSSSSSGGTEVTSIEAAAALEHIADMERATARMRHSLERIARGDAPDT